MKRLLFIFIFLSLWITAKAETAPPDSVLGTNLVSATAVNPADYLFIIQSGTTKKVTWSLISDSAQAIINRYMKGTSPLSGIISKFNGSYQLDTSAYAISSIKYAKLNLTNSILNADVNSSAAIAYSKLNLSNSIVTGDIVDGTITNSDINSSAAIDYSKLNLSNSITTSDIQDTTLALGDLSYSLKNYIDTRVGGGTLYNLPDGNTIKQKADSTLYADTTLIATQRMIPFSAAYGFITPKVDTMIIYKNMGYNPQYSAFEVVSYDTVGGGSLDGHAIPFFAITYNKARGFVNSQWGTGQGFFDHIHHDSASAFAAWTDYITTDSYLFDSWNYSYNPFQMNTIGNTSIGLLVDTTVMFRVYPRNNVKYTMRIYGASEFDSLQVGLGYTSGNINIDSSLVLGYRHIQLYTGATKLYNLDLKMIAKTASPYGYKYSYILKDNATSFNDTVMTFDNDGSVYFGEYYGAHTKLYTTGIQTYSAGTTGGTLHLNWYGGYVATNCDFSVNSAGSPKFTVASATGNVATTGTITSTGNIITSGTLLAGSVSGGGSVGIDSILVSSADTSKTIYLHGAGSIKFQNWKTTVLNSFDEPVSIIMMFGMILPFLFYNRKKILKSLIILFAFVSIGSTQAQTKQDSLNVQRAQYQFQSELQGEQQLEQSLNLLQKKYGIDNESYILLKIETDKQKIKAFDAWKQLQIALIPFQKEQLKPEEIKKK